MDDVTFCVEKNVPIVPEEGEEEEATVSLAAVDLGLHSGLTKSDSHVSGSCCLQA